MSNHSIRINSIPRSNRSRPPLKCLWVIAWSLGKRKLWKDLGKRFIQAPIYIFLNTECVLFFECLRRPSWRTVTLRNYVIVSSPWRQWHHAVMLHRDVTWHHDGVWRHSHLTSWRHTHMAYVPSSFTAHSVILGIRQHDQASVFFFLIGF